MKILVNGQTATLVSSDTLIQNSSTIYTVEFEFDDSWNGYDKTIIFKAGKTEESVSLTGDVCIIPSDCLKEAGVVLKLGIFGTKNGETTNTIWFNTTRILYNWEINSGGYSAPIRSGELVNHVAKFYTSSDKSGEPAFIMNIPEEMFLDQAKTEFVSDFVWSSEMYPGSTNPELDGKSVFVLAVKGEDPESPPSYSFLDMDMAGGGGGDLPDDIYDMLPYDTVSGETVEFTDGADNIPVKSFMVNLGVIKFKEPKRIVHIDDMRIEYQQFNSIQFEEPLEPGTYVLSMDITRRTDRPWVSNATATFGMLYNSPPTSQDDISYKKSFQCTEQMSHVTDTFVVENTVNFISFAAQDDTVQFANIVIEQQEEEPPTSTIYTADDIADINASSQSSVKVKSLSSEIPAGTYTIKFTPHLISNPSDIQTSLQIYLINKNPPSSQSDAGYQSGNIIYTSDVPIEQTINIDKAVSYIMIIGAAGVTAIVSNIQIIGEYIEPFDDHPFMEYTGVTITQTDDAFTLDKNFYTYGDMTFRSLSFFGLSSPLTPGRYTIRGSLLNATELPQIVFRVKRDYNTNYRSSTITECYLHVDSEIVDDSTIYHFDETFILKEEASLMYFKDLGNQESITITGLEIRQFKNEISIDFSNTVSDVYCGKLDVVNSKLEITHKFIELDGSSDETWTKQEPPNGSIGNSCFKTSISPYSDRQIATGDANNYYISIVPTDATIKNYDSTSEGGCVYQDYLYIRIKGHETDTVEEFKSYLAGLKESGTPLQVVYELIEPETYDISKTEVKTLLGGNKISCDGGSMTVEYRADTDLYIEKKLQQVESIGYVVKFDDVNGVLTCNKSYSEIYDRWNNYGDVVGVFDGMISSSIKYSENLDYDYEYPVLWFSFSDINIQDTNGINIFDIAIESNGDVYYDESFSYRFNSTGLAVTGRQSGSTLLCDKTVGDVMDAFRIGANVVLNIFYSEVMHISSLKFVDIRKNNGSYTAIFEFDQPLNLIFQHTANTESDLMEQYLRIENYFPDDGGSEESQAV